MKKDEVFSKKVADRLNKHIKEKFKHRSDFIRELNKQNGFPVENTRQGECFISESRLSQILKGDNLDYAYALGFSKVLGLPVEYLMGEIDYPSKEAKENALWLEALSQWNKEDQERFNTFKRILSLLSDRQFMFEFQLKEQYEVTDLNGQMHFASARIISHNMQHTLIDGCSYPLDDVTFLSWLCFDTLTIKIKNNSTPKKYYHIDAYDNKKQLKPCIHIVDKKNNRLIELDMNSFMHMIYDIDESIQATIQNRCDCWMKYANYDYKEALERSFTAITE